MKQPAPSTETTGDVNATHTGPTYRELYYLIQRFLDGGPCQQAAQLLRREIESHGLICNRFAIDNTQRTRSFSEFDSLVGQEFSRNFLHQALSLLHKLQNSLLPPSLSRLNVSFLGTGRQSLVRKKESQESVKWSLKKCASAVLGVAGKLPPNTVRVPGIPGLSFGRELGGKTHRTQPLGPRSLLKNLEIHSRSLGHLSSAFCLAFDRSGEYIFSGADDNLVKLWCMESGRLRFTFRGSGAEITDMTVSQENTLLAVGSVDKSIRVWCLRTGNAVAVLNAHTAMVTSLHFLPFFLGDNRLLVSTSNDCSVCFWKWNASNNEFQTPPIKFPERLRPGAQMVCSTYSPGGRFVVTGCTDCHVRIYSLQSGFPERILEVEAHTDRVDSLQWAHRGLRFVSGSKDGTSKIWTYTRQEWHQILLPVADTKPERSGEVTTTIGGGGANKGTKTKVTMVAWSLDDSLVVAAASDFVIRVWNSSTGAFLRFLHGHKDESFVLNPHPVHQSVMISAGHDGCLMLWDIQTGALIKRHYNFIDGFGHGAFFDCQFSGDGGSLAAVDSHGNISILGIGSDDKLCKAPKEQFFHTDYRPLIRDSNGFVLDEQTQLAPHLMPPPFLVDANGAPLPPDEQKHVPGKERLSKSYLYAEIVQRTDEESNLVDIERESSTSPPNPPAEAGNERQANEPNATNQRPTPSTEEEPYSVWLSRPLIRPLKPSILKVIVGEIDALAAEEAEDYETETGKVRLALPPQTQPLDSTKGRDEERSLRVRRRNNPPTHDYQTRYNPVPSDTIRNDDYVYPETLNLRDSSQSSTGLSESGRDSSDPETSDSDYSAHLEQPAPSTSRSKAKIPRPRTRRRVQGNEGDEELEEEESESEEEQEEEETPVNQDRRLASPSRKSTSARRRSKPTRKPCIKKKSDDRVDQDATDFPYYDFPEWITAMEARKTPYFPQPGDEVVYYKEGHSLYLQAVERHDLYPVSKKMLPKENLAAEEIALVESVKFQLYPYRLVCLRMLQLAQTGNRSTDFRYQVRYHDMPGVIDFIVLRQHYEKAVAQHWQAGDRFQAIIDNKWWFGSVTKARGQDEDSGRNNFQSIVVRWETGDEEEMSPWDLETFNPEMYPGKKGDAVEATPEELQEIGAYEPKSGEWGEMGREEETQRLIEAIEELQQLAAMDPFRVPVDLTIYPDYPSRIAYPIDFFTVVTRLRNKFYRRMSAVERDIWHMAENARTFNEEGSEIVKTAKVIRETLIRFIRHRDNDEIVTEIHRALSSLPETELDVMDATRRRKPSRKEIKTETPLWVSQCEEIVGKLVDDRDAAPFVDTESSELSDIFDSAFNLKTISEKLTEGGYSSPEELSSDVDNLFQNCKSVATNKRSNIYKSALKLHAQFTSQIQSVISEWRRKNSVKQQEKKDQKLRKRSSKEHLYNTRSSGRTPHPQRRPTLEYVGDVEDKPSTSTASALSTSRRPARTARKSEHTLINGRGGSQTEESQSDSEPPTPPPHTTHSGRNKANNSISTRNRGKRTVVYAETSSEEESPATYSQSSRGRIRKLRRVY